MKSPARCAEALGLTAAELTVLAAAAPTYYEPFPKLVGGKQRQIDNPQDPLKTVQRRIERRLLRRLLTSNISYGGVPGRSHFDAAALHVGKPAVACLDIAACFPSITHHHVYALLIAMDSSPDVARVLTQLLTFEGHLPQGSPASTTVANLLLAGLDLELATAAVEAGLMISRFIDDLVISGDSTRVARLLDRAIRILNDLSLRVSYRKTGIRRSGDSQEALGLTVNRRVAVPKSYRKMARDDVRCASRYGIADAERRSLEGRLQYVSRTHPQSANTLGLQLATAPRTGR